MVIGPYEASSLGPPSENGNRAPKEEALSPHDEKEPDNSGIVLSRVLSLQQKSHIMSCGSAVGRGQRGEMGKFGEQCTKHETTFIREEVTTRPLTTFQLTEPSGFRIFGRSTKYDSTRRLASVLLQHPASRSSELAIPTTIHVPHRGRNNEVTGFWPTVPFEAN